jgi:hypothetical protein
LVLLVRERALPFQPRGRGRGGERLGMLAAAARFFAAAARVQASDPATGYRLPYELGEPAGRKPAACSR